MPMSSSALHAGDDRPARLEATVRVLDMAFFRKVVLRHDTGLGEAYMDGDYEVRSSNWNMNAT